MDNFDPPISSLVRLRFLPTRGVARHARTGVAKNSVQMKALVPPQVLSSKSNQLKRGGIAKRWPNSFSIRLSKEQGEIVLTKANAAGIPLIEHIKTSILGSAYRPPLNPELYPVLINLTRELTHQGTKLNEINRQLKGKVISPAQVETLLAMIARSFLHTHKALQKVLANGRSDY